MFAETEVKEGRQGVTVRVERETHSDKGLGIRRVDDHNNVFEKRNSSQATQRRRW